jgi:hypothetical protein
VSQRWGNEVRDTDRQMLAQMLALHGWIAFLRQRGYPPTGIDMARLKQSVLEYSKSIRPEEGPEDDLTILEVRFLDA